MLKAIETRYNGYRFRSRLEARWAVFFDTLGVPYEYEREGFDLDGVRYLPDFWIFDRAWVEIKPYPAYAFSEKCRRLQLASQYTVVNICGEPWPFRYQIAMYCEGGYDCPVIGAGDRPLQFSWTGKELHIQNDLTRYWINHVVTDDREARYDHPALIRAYEAARSARFEFGR